MRGGDPRVSVPTRILCKYITGWSICLNIFRIWRFFPSFKVIEIVDLFGTDWVSVFRISILHGRVFDSSSGRRMPSSKSSWSSGRRWPEMTTSYSFSLSYLGWVSLFISSVSFVRIINPSVFLSNLPIGLRPLSWRSSGSKSRIVCRSSSSSKVVM